MATRNSVKVTDSIRAVLSEKARQSPGVWEEVEAVARDLNAMLAFNPTRKAWVEVAWRGRYWLVEGKSRLEVEGPSITTDYTRHV